MKKINWPVIGAIVLILVVDVAAFYAFGRFLQFVGVMP